MKGNICITSGCFETAYGNNHCGYCLDGKLPLERGPVTHFEALRARRLGGENKEITLLRLIKHDQPTGILD